MKKFIIFVISLIICFTSLGLTACDNIDNPKNGGGNTLEFVGIRLEIWDDKNQYIDTIASTIANGPQTLSLNEDQRYVFKILPIQRLKSAQVIIEAKYIAWGYNNEIINIEKCNEDEFDTSYYVKCKKVNETAKIVIRVGEFSLEVNVCFEKL